MSFGAETQATAINNAGQVAGIIKVFPNPTAYPLFTAFVYTPGVSTALVDPLTIGQITFQNTVLSSLNIHGDGAGYAYRTGGAGQTALGYIGGVSSDIGITPTGSVAYGINDSGVIVGGPYVDSKNVYHPGFIYKAGTRPLTPLAGGQPYAINNVGQITGSANGHAFIGDVTTRTLTDIGTLPGDSDARGRAINDAGQVVGESSGSSGERGFLYSGGLMTDLGGLGGSTIPMAINLSGDVVGEADSATAQRAFLYTSGHLYDLNSLIPTDSGIILTSAVGINDAGQIAANAVSADGQSYYGVVLTPAVPEPDGIGVLIAFVALSAPRSKKKPRASRAVP